MMGKGLFASSLQSQSFFRYLKHEEAGSNSTPPGQDASPLLVPIYTPGWRGTVRVKCLTQEQNTVSPARARPCTAQSRDNRTNHEATTMLS